MERVGGGNFVLPSPSFEVGLFFEYASFVASHGHTDGISELISGGE